jgi:SPP1 gp7 family putative phage head morphogenesis protein
MLPIPGRDPLVVEVARAQQSAILAREESVLRGMAERWLRVEQALAAEMTATAAEIAALEASGQPVSAALIRMNERYTRLVYQAHAELSRYVQYAGGQVSAYQAALAAQGVADAAEAIKAVFDGAGIVGAQWDRLPVEAVNMMIGMAGDGTPLEQYLRSIYASSTDGMTQALINGIAQGLNPVETARLMRDGFGMGLNQALNTARTESLRAYRMASLEQYRHSGVVQGWKRVAKHDERTCAGCLFSEGEVYPVAQHFQEHNNGRCTLIPWVTGMEEPSWQTGQAWFQTQDQGTQMSILGSGRYAAWQNGTPLGEMVKRRNDPVWGESFVPTPVAELAIVETP